MSTETEQSIEVQREIAKGEIKKALEKALEYLKKSGIKNLTDKDRDSIESSSGGVSYRIETRNLNLSDRQLEEMGKKNRESGNQEDYGKSFQYIKIEPTEEGQQYYPHYYIGKKWGSGDFGEGLQYGFTKAEGTKKTGESEVKAQLDYPEHRPEKINAEKDSLSEIPSGLRDFQGLLESIVEKYKRQQEK